MAVDVLDQLKGLPLLQGLSPEEQRELCRWLRPIQVASGEVIFRQGERGAALLIVLSGFVRIDVTDPEGEIQSVGNIQAGDILGEIAFLDPGPRSATAVAASETLLVELTDTDFGLLERRAPLVASRVLTWMTVTTARRLRNVNRDLERTIAAHAKVGPVGTPSPSQSGSALGRLWARISGGIDLE